MRFSIAIFSVAIAIAAPAAASDQVQFGPKPAWVKPVDPPAAGADESGGGAAFRILFTDQQVLLEPGRQVVYLESAFRIDTPQGLALGNLSFPWQPDTSVLTVHKLHIRRGDDILDVLASGETFIVARRERNLETATLDGVLTANIQPEGLRVGDILEFAVSVSSSNPALGTHVEQIGGLWNDLPIDRAHLRVEWPSGMPMHLRQTGELPTTKPVKDGDRTAFELTMDGIEPVAAPRGAPPRYRLNRLVEFSDFASWAELGALMAPLYREAATLPADSSLWDEVKRIRALSPDPQIRAEAALALVQDQVRYVALMMGVDGLVPASAETSWARRYGDCKAKTALLLALLQALDIEAEAVLVSNSFGDGLDAHLPMAALFDHVLVRASIDGQQYWLDGTRTGDTRLDRLPVPAFGWGLPVRDKGATLLRMLPEPLALPSMATTIHFDASAGLSLPAPMKVEQLFRGAGAISINLNMANLTAEARERELRSYFRGQYNFVDISSVAASFDAASGEQRLTMEGSARLDWSKGYYRLEDMGIGYDADFTRDPGPNEDAPFAVPYPYFTSITQTMLLPPGFPSFERLEGAEVDARIAGIEYRRHASLADNLFTIERSERSMAPEFPANEAAEAQKQLRELADRQVLLRVPQGYRQTDAEMEARVSANPETWQEFAARGVLHSRRRQDAEAILDFDKAIELAPNEAALRISRAITLFALDEFDKAEADLAVAEAAGVNDSRLFLIRGLIASRKGADDAAKAAFDAALDRQPDNRTALTERARTNQSLGNYAEALEDATAALALAPPRPAPMRLVRINSLRMLGRYDEALAETAELVASNPDDGYAQVTAGRAFAAFGKREEAMQAFERALAGKPEAYMFVNRAESRPYADFAGRRADLEEALKLDPTLEDALSAMARLQSESGAHGEAIAGYTEAIARLPDEVELLIDRGAAFARSGNRGRAEEDFAAARAKASGPRDLNNLCFAKATSAVALQSALADCDEALRLQPGSPSSLDSRGLTLLRLGRLDEAIAAYDAVLARAPGMSESRFGRAIAWARKGDQAKSDADLAAALRMDPDVEERFRRYGIER